MKASEASSRATISGRPEGPADRSARSANRFRLDGPTRQLDPRVHAARRDIADIALAGLLFAPHYARPELSACVAASTMLRDAPSTNAVATSQLLCGEEFAVLDVSGGWAWGYCAHDHYVGYLPADVLGAPDEPTHVVASAAALLFTAPNIKSAVLDTLSLGARLHGELDGSFLATRNGYIHLRHIARFGAPVDDAAAVAETLLGQPYLWGGRGAGGVDCSGLVQIALGRAGIAVPRDTDQQRGAVGVEIATSEALRRGDLVYFPGHVGLMVDDERMIHANAHWMAVTIEPLADVVARLAPDHARPVLARRRIA